MNASFLFMLADDIGWADFGYNGGIAHTPNIDGWGMAEGSVRLMDMHSGGTVCAPTRASVLTGRNHFRDCVNSVYDCSDPTEGMPIFEFAPQRTYTIADAFRRGHPHSGRSFFAGKWHLGSFYNDSEAYGGFTSSPTTHGFDSFNATLEVAPTATLNHQCTLEWNASVDYGHYHRPNHCQGGPNPGGGGLRHGCCFNYWWPNMSAAQHGVSNLTWQTPFDDAVYLVDSFERFVSGQAAAGSSPFLAHLSFHNCHIPFIGSAVKRAACTGGSICHPPASGEPPYSDEELDYYSCLSMLDDAVGAVLTTLERHGYAQDTLTWLTTDNGPEVNCPPAGVCKGRAARPHEAPGTAGPLRGRKRDIWEGGHRVPGIVSYPRLMGSTNYASWQTVTTMDLLPTIMEVLGDTHWPTGQAHWARDGMSILPILRGDAQASLPARGIGWAMDNIEATPHSGYGFRYGKWKLVVGSISCAVDECLRPMLYDLDADLGERHDLSQQAPMVLKAMLHNYSLWQQSVRHSRTHESRCQTDGGFTHCGR